MDWSRTLTLHRNFPLAPKLLRNACLYLGLAWLPGAWPAESPGWLLDLEVQYLETRNLADALDIAGFRGADTTSDGQPLGEVRQRYARLRTALEGSLVGASRQSQSTTLDPVDQRALAAMHAGLALLTPAEVEPAAEAPGCASGLGANPASLDFATLSQNTYACFAQAALNISFRGETLDRLTVFSRLATTTDREQRRALWLSLLPLWQAVNGDNGPRSPYRHLIRLRAAELEQSRVQPGAAVRGLGVEPAAMEAWLETALGLWRDSLPDLPIEPWDYAWQAGAAARSLAPALPLERMRGVAEAYYRDLGADPVALNIQYDLEPRAGKSPVAFTTFGRRPAALPGQAGLHGADQHDPGQPWIFATYRVGGLDNFNELAHELGHAVHIAAIRTRPAFADWPDSDIFTEGVAELASLELFEVDWQQRYLGRAAAPDDNHRARYAGIIMDMAWALFELRMLRAPESDPNAVWTRLAEDYLRIVPHPEHAWWAVRGQLIEAPGYMLNYAAGAILVADLRARIRELWGADAFTRADWYARLSASLYRFGLERDTASVLLDFLGRAPDPQALFAELNRAGSPVQAGAIEP